MYQKCCEVFFYGHVHWSKTNNYKTVTKITLVLIHPVKYYVILITLELMN